MATKSSLFNDTPFLLFTPHETQKDIALDISEGDIAVLRELAKRYAEAGSDSGRERVVNNWNNINNLTWDKPTIWMNEIPWHEMDVNGELTMKCESDVARRIESEMRKTLYQWNHMRGDMVIDPVFYAPVILENSGYGLQIEAEVRETDAENTIASRHFEDIIRTEDDIERIETPVIRHDPQRTKAFRDLYAEIFDSILPVETRGVTGFWFAPWDDIVMWKGAEPTLLDLALKPDLMHKLIDRLVSCSLGALDQFIELNLLARNDINVRVGSGGYGYVSGLPKPDCDPARIRTEDMWGSATPQIFASVSPAMHEEFGIDYERRWLERFGLAYYGCCEPLDGKMDEIAKIPNLRKISVSPWADKSRAAERMKGKYAVSYKPSSAMVSTPHFDEDAIREYLRGDLLQLKGCCVEIILKDISTVQYEPHRLWRWTDIAKEVIAEIYR
ncbi:MAG: uroporphyrinogen decarboxylase family protein [Clostridiales Family XIII bacterium]|jgi:hypothetical protein|nr:uroporphyrinogen decarboxylase family protein [Clostridiales Family XIII bacterium]